MAGFFDFIKKPNGNASNNQGVTSSVTQTTQSQSTPQAYSGIGTPPGGGTPYSGIGSPPGGGQPYSGIGTPPVTQNSQLPITNNQTISNVQKNPNVPNNPTMKQSSNETMKPFDQTQGKQSNNDLVQKFSSRSKEVIATAQGKAKELKSQYVESEHLLFALLSDHEISNLLTKLKAQIPVLQEETKKAFKTGNNTKDPEPSPQVKKILSNAVSVSEKSKSEHVEPEHILLAVIEEGEGVGARVLTTAQIKKEDIEKAILEKSVIEKPKTPEELKKEELDLMTHLTQRSNRVFLSAQTKAKEINNQYVDSEHLLHGLLADTEIYNFFTEQKIQPQAIEEELTKIYTTSPKISPNQVKLNNQPQLSPRVKRILDNSLVIARKLGFEFISPEHLLLALYEEGEGAGARVLAKLGLKKEDLNKKITGKKEGLGEEGKAQTKKSALQEYTIDLTAKAANGLLDKVVERSEVIERVIHILSRRTKNNPALVGEAGVGKTAIVEGLAQKIVSKEVPEPLLNKKILQLDLMSMLAGASHRGDFEERMKNLIEEVKSSQNQIILFIDEIHNIVGAGATGEGSMDASNFLKPALARGELQLIGATTLTEYRKYVEKDPALERRFQPVLVPEPTEEQAVKMLQAIKDKYEAFHRVTIPQEALDAAVKFSKRYVGDRFLPDKAVDLIDEAASAVRLPLISLPEEIKSGETRIAELNQDLTESEKKGDQVRGRILKSKIDELQVDLKEKQDQYNLKKGQSVSSVTVEIIKDVVSRWTGIPVSKISGSELEKLAKLEDIMHERLIDQEVAVESVAQAVRRGRAGLKSTARPIGSFVFLGPTGVGKTELAKTLADILFGQEEAMIRFDMTEYMEKHEVAKLLGAPPGYVGYEEGGKLTEAVRRRPYSVVLFDEVEKAHPDIFNILLQILDDGRLTDNKGHVISFKNSVVICTSNIGTQIIQDDLMRNGKVEVEEPPTISSYAFSPRGREVLTIGNKYFEREVAQINQQKSEKISKNQKPDKPDKPDKSDDVSGAWKPAMLQDYFAGQMIDNQAEKILFPVQGFDTHVMSSTGVETITKGVTVYYRTSTTAKTWKTTTLIDLYKDNVVVNALPDAPEEQLPTIKLRTHAINGEEAEIVSYKDRYWKRKAGVKDWETGYLRDYFVNATIDKESKFPTSHWDIHTFSPQGTEIIIVGDKIWFKNQADTKWQAKTIKDYFGEDFPLDKEIEEKNKVETELDRKKYSVIKDKVMGELRKFFRPELINRFDEVIIFEPLKFIHMIAIVKLQLKGVVKLLEDQDMGFIYTDAAVKEIVRSGFDPIYGARPLRRAIQKLIENPISSLIIDGKVKPGDQILVDFDGDGFVFNVEKVEMVDESKLAGIKKNYLCEKCGNKFETVIVKNSTVICPKCASTKLQETIEESSFAKASEGESKKEEKIDKQDEVKGKEPAENKDLKKAKEDLKITDDKTNSETNGTAPKTEELPDDNQQQISTH
jgi:ATP-dependent Clp protease ATP-binding subunit ClpC